MIIDSHVHLSSLKKPAVFPEIKKRLKLSMKRNKVDYSLVIPDNVPRTDCADMNTLLEMMTNERNLFIIATLKVTEVNELNLKKLSGLFADKIIHGFKIFSGHDPVYPTDKRWLPIFKLCVKHDKPLIVHTGINPGNEKVARYNDPKHIVKIARAHPKLKIILSHYFWPQLDYCFSMTDGFPNIYFDTSALADPEVVRKSGGIKKVREILKKTVERRNESVIFGSDWPLCGVERHVNLINSLDIPDAYRRGIFRDNAIDIFNLPL